MASLIFILVTLGLLVGFFVLSGYEERKGARVLARGRTRLDETAERFTFIVTHVDFSSFLREEIQRASRRFVHTIAHLSLQAVRAVERFLTQIVRYLRTKHAVDVTPRENTREFVRTLSDFKEHLEANRPEVPDVLE